MQVLLASEPKPLREDPLRRKQRVLPEGLRKVAGGCLGEVLRDGLANTWAPLACATRHEGYGFVSGGVFRKEGNHRLVAPAVCEGLRLSDERCGAARLPADVCDGAKDGAECDVTPITGVCHLQVQKKKFPDRQVRDVCPGLHELVIPPVTASGRDKLQKLVQGSAVSRCALALLGIEVARVQDDDARQEQANVCGDRPPCAEELLRHQRASGPQGFVDDDLCVRVGLRVRVVVQDARNPPVKVLRDLCGHLVVVCQHEGTTLQRLDCFPIHLVPEHQSGGAAVGREWAAGAPEER
mmetsp:Transcript_48833/g.145943  ORF Transcript_48833/g.145943 Transcript_48833/m.145943 type:complete len:296 (-) Transcript_48833:271-1158(-)